MKRLTFLIALGAILLIGSWMNYEGSTAADIPGYYSTFSWTFTHDTTSGNFPNTDTIDSLSGSSDAKIFLYNGIGRATDIRGQVYVEMTGYDTSAGGTLMDTAKDSVAFTIYSGFAEMPDTVWAVYTDSLARANTYKGAVQFNVPSDSVIGDFIFFKFITVVADSNVADLASSLTYRATVVMKAVGY